jgi:deoxyribonuclease-4
MAVRFGPGGNSVSFGKRKFPADIAQYLKDFSLNCYEIECGRGVRISEATYTNLPAIA